MFMFEFYIENIEEKEKRLETEYALENKWNFAELPFFFVAQKREIKLCI